MTEEKQELQWWEKPETPKEQRETVESLVSQITVMQKAGSKLSTRYLIRLFTVLTIIAFNIYILYLEFQGPNIVFVFVYCFTNILIGFDALSSARKLRDIASSKPVVVDRKVPKHCGHCGKPLDYLEETK